MNEGKTSRIRVRVKVLFVSLNYVFCLLELYVYALYVLYTYTTQKQGALIKCLFLYVNAIAFMSECTHVNDLNLP